MKSPAWKASATRGSFAPTMTTSKTPRVADACQAGDFRGARTRLESFRDAGFLRTDYDDIEDYGQMHLTFDDGTVADIFSSELVLGGVHNWLEVFANNHRTRCNLNPIDALETYNPREELFKDVYVTEKIGTKQGWSHPAPDEDWQHGYPQEFQDFVESIGSDREPRSGGELARD